MSILQTGTATNSGTSATISITHGLTINSGDTVVAIIAVNGSNIPAEGAWNPDLQEVYSNNSAVLSVLTLVAGGSEPATYNFTMAASDRYAIILRVYSGVDAAIWDVLPNVSTLGATTDQTAPSITTLTDNTEVIFCSMSDTESTNTYSGITNGFADEFNSLSHQTVASYTKTVVTAGVVGTTTVTPSVSVNWLAMQGALKEATAGGLTLDSTPTDNRVTESRSVTVSDSAVTPTDANVQIKLIGDTGPEAGSYSVTGSGPWVINYTFPRTTAKKFDATGYPIYIEVAAENVTSANVPFLPVTTQTFVDLSSPVAVAGTYGEAYAGALAVTNDQRVHDIVTTAEGIPLDADGADYGAAQDFWSLRAQPIATQTATFYLIQADGTVDVEDTITFVVETGGDFDTLQQWVDSLTEGGSTTDKIMLFLNSKGFSGGVTDMMYEYLKTKSSKNSNSERYVEWREGGFN